MKGVVTILGFEADFDVVAGTSVPREDFLHFPAEVALHFQNESADAPVGVLGAIRQNLLGEGVHTTCRFSRADGAHDSDACEQTSFWDDQPARCFRGDLLAGVMYLAHHERKFCPFPGGRIERQFPCSNPTACFEGENVDAGKQDRVHEVRRCIEEEGVGVLEKEKGRRRADGHDPQKDIVFREWRPKVERHSRSRREKASEEVSRMEDSLDHARAAFSAAWTSFLSACVCCCLRQRRNSTSLQITIFSAELTT